MITRTAAQDYEPEVASHRLCSEEEERKLQFR
jgi:hypothetical protein